MRPQRRGLSLTEVLVAMFVMALGLMALLTLFPLGAMQIGQALKDDRTASTVAQADTWVRVWWRDAVTAYDGNPDALPIETALAALDDPNVEGTGQAIINPGQANAYFRAPAVGAALNLLPTGTSLGASTGSDFATPRTSLIAATVRTGSNNPPNTITDRFVSIQTRRAGGTIASYPFLLDPLGFTATRSGLGAFDRSWVGRNSGTVYGMAGGASPLLIPRRSTLNTPNGPTAYAACALTDDLTFQPNGGAGQGEPLARQGRYHWAALIQRPDNSQPDVASLTVLVFDGRPPFLGIAGDEVTLTNNYINPLGPSALGTVTAGDRSLSLLVPVRGADQPPLVRRGGWVAIASMTNGVRMVGFHRITGLTTLDDTTATNPAVPVTQVSLDIDPPVQATLVAGQAQVYLLAGLSEVFHRPPMTR